MGAMALRLLVLGLLGLTIGLKPGPDSDCQCEEGWAYLQFLKDHVETKVERLLAGTLGQERGISRQLSLEDRLQNTLEKVMEIRESLLDRIRAIRKKEDYLELCDPSIGQATQLSRLRMDVMKILLELVDIQPKDTNTFRDISNSLLQFKKTVSDEVMRVLMLPQANCDEAKTNDKDPQDSCKECVTLETLKVSIGHLLACVIDKEATTNKDCVPVTMVAMELIKTNDVIDRDIKELYTEIAGKEGEEKTNSFEELIKFKEIRDSIDGAINKLMEETDEEKLKLLIPQSLRRVSSVLKQRLSECVKEHCGCESCAAQVVSETISLVEGYQAYFPLTDLLSEKAAREYVRNDVIQYIQKIVGSSRSILRDQVTGVKLDSCTDDKLAAFSMVKTSLWTLVNSTIYEQNMEAVEDVIANTRDILDEKLRWDICFEASNKMEASEEMECDWEEYQETRDYIKALDTIIAETIFHPEKHKDARVKALLGFVDLQTMLENRVNVLFEKALICPDEVMIIKTQYMSQLTKCMAKFMNTKTNFGTGLIRRERIECTKVLREVMEQRISILLESEVNQGLNQI